MDIVTPFETSCSNKGFDYDRLIEKFGVHKSSKKDNLQKFTIKEES